MTRYGIARPLGLALTIGLLTIACAPAAPPPSPTSATKPTTAPAAAPKTDAPAAQPTTAPAAKSEAPGRQAVIVLESGRVGSDCGGRA